MTYDNLDINGCDRYDNAPQICLLAFIVKG